LHKFKVPAKKFRGLNGPQPVKKESFRPVPAFQVAHQKQRTWNQKNRRYSSVISGIWNMLITSSVFHRTAPNARSSTWFGAAISLSLPLRTFPGQFAASKRSDHSAMHFSYLWRLPALKWKKILPQQNYPYKEETWSF